MGRGLRTATGRLMEPEELVKELGKLGINPIVWFMHFGLRPPAEVTCKECWDYELEGCRSRRDPVRCMRRRSREFTISKRLVRAFEMLGINPLVWVMHLGFKPPVKKITCGECSGYRWGLCEGGRHPVECMREKSRGDSQARISWGEP